MDLLTQGLLGSVLAQSAAKPDELRRASIIGFFSGLLADADIIIQSAADPLLTLEYHRHFTHSIFFIPLGALLAAIILWPFFRHKISFTRLYTFSLLGYSLSGFIDACTSYGTHLLWPLSDERIAFGIISIVDPVFTFTLLVVGILALKKHHSKFAHLGLILCAAYLLIGVIQSQRADSGARQLAFSRGHNIDKLFVKPTLGNLLLWRSTYISADRIYVDAIRAGAWGKPTIYIGESTALFNLQRELPEIPENSVLMHDIKRFLYFSDGYVALHPQHHNVLGDLRYSMLATSVLPLWALRIDPSNPQAHGKYEFFRNFDRDTRRQFIAMLLGKEQH